MRFSIVIPTKDRADKLRYALQSATWQTLEDYEVVVSDNHSSDHTADVIGRFARGNWTCLRPPCAMSMPDHWEFALKHARGDWVLVLCDDDVLIPTALARLDDVLRTSDEPDIVQYDPWPPRPFVYDDGVRDDGNFMEMTDRLPFTIRQVDPRLQLELCVWRNAGDMPKMLNCAARRELLDQIRQHYGRLFGAWAPDYHVGAKLLAECNRFVHVGSVAVYGENMASYGYGSTRDPEHLLRFFRQFSEFTGRFRHSPYPDLFVVSNAIFETFRIVLKELGPEYSHLETDPLRLRRYLINNAKRYVEYGFTQFQIAVDQVSRDLRHERIRELLSPRRLARRLARTPALVRFHVDRRRQKKISRPRRRHYFPDILAAACEVDRRLPPPPCRGRRRVAA